MLYDYRLPTTAEDRRLKTEDKKNGLTLIEVLISISILAVVGGLLSIIIVNSTGLFYKQSSNINIGLNINDSLARVRSSIKESNAVASSYSTDSENYTSGVTQIVFKVPSLDSSGNIISGIFDYFVFFQDQTKLHFKTFPDPASSRKAQDQIFSNIVDSLVFKYFNFENPPIEVTPVNASKVRITLTLKQKMGANYETNIATTEANLRND